MDTSLFLDSGTPFVLLLLSKQIVVGSNWQVGVVSKLRINLKLNKMKTFRNDLLMSDYGGELEDDCPGLSPRRWVEGPGGRACGVASVSSGGEVSLTLLVHLIVWAVLPSH